MVAKVTSKVERLQVAGAIAPVLRSQSERTSNRRVGIVDKDGKVVGYTSVAQFQEAILRRAEIELAVTDGKRPKTVLCERCGKLVRVKARGSIPRECVGGCDRQDHCAGWAETEGVCKVVPKFRSAFSPYSVKKRRGEPWRCKSCALRRSFSKPDVALKKVMAGRKMAADPNWIEKMREAARRRLATDKGQADLRKAITARIAARRKPRLPDSAKTLDTG